MTADLANKHGFSKSNALQLEAQCGKLEASEAKPLRALEDENGCVKPLLANAIEVP